MTLVLVDRLVVLASVVAVLLVGGRLAVFHPFTAPLLCRATSGRKCAPERAAGAGLLRCLKCM